MIKVADFLKGGPPKKARIFAVTGEEAFLRDEAVRCILESLPEDVEVQRIQGSPPGGGKMPEIRDLFDDLRMQGLFGGERVIHLQDADAFVKEHQKTLVRFLSEGEAAHRLVIEGRALMGRGRKTVPKTGILPAIEKLGGVVVPCDALYDSPFQGRGPEWQSPLSRWVVDRARKRGKQMSMEDAWTLHRMVGNRLRELDTELGKLATFVGARPQITADDVEQCTGAGRLAPVFELAEAVAARQGTTAVEQSQLLFERGLHDFSGRHVRDVASVAMIIIGAVSSRMRKVARVREMMAAGESFQDAAGAVRQAPMFRDRLRAQVESWNEEGTLVRAMAGLLVVERELKSGGGSPRVLFDRFLVECLGLQEVVARRGASTWRR